jgi:predicted TIM-barrel enzyme
MEVIMITKRWTKKEIIEKLQDKIQKKKPLLFTSCGNGLNAKVLEKAGADSVTAFSGGRLRSNGVGSMQMYWPIYDSNGQLLDNITYDIMPALKGDAFVTACMNFNDPRRDMRVYFEQLKNVGVLSVTNSGPTFSAYEKGTHMYEVLKQSGVTFENEIEALKLAKEMGMVTIAMPFTLEDSIKMVEEVRPDIYCFHAGTTKGGLVGYATPDTVEDTSKRTEEVYSAVRKIKPDMILLTHGAALETPQEGQYILDNTSGHGLWTGSATERIPIERAILETAGEFANLTIK